MTYYDISIDISGPARQKIVVPVGADFAVTVHTLNNGVPCKVIPWGASGKVSEVVADLLGGNNPIQGDWLKLIDGTAYQVNAATELGTEVFTRFFVKGSDVEKTDTLTFVWKHKYYNDEQGGGHIKYFTPNIQCVLEISYVNMGRNCNGADYNVQAVGGVTSKTATLNALSVVYRTKNQGGVVDVLNITQNKAMINGHLTEPYNMGGMTMNNNNGFFELSGNICFD